MDYLPLGLIAAEGETIKTFHEAYVKDIRVQTLQQRREQTVTVHTFMTTTNFSKLNQY